MVVLFHLFLVYGLGILVGMGLTELAQSEHRFFLSFIALIPMYFLDKSLSNHIIKKPKRNNHKPKSRY